MLQKSLHNREWDELVTGGNIDLGNLDEDDEATTGAIMQALLQQGVSDAAAVEQASMRALRSANSKGQNEVGFAMLNDWYEATTVKAIEQLMIRHQTEPETTKMLNSLTLGPTALDPEITQLPTGEIGPDGRPILVPGNLALFARIYVEQQRLKDAGALPADANLVRELQAILLGESWQMGDQRVSLYDLPEIRGMFKTRTESAAALNRLIFQNNSWGAYRAGIEKVIRMVPLDDLEVGFAFAHTQKRMEELAPYPGEERIEAFRKMEMLEREHGDKKGMAEAFRALIGE